MKRRSIEYIGVDERHSLLGRHFGQLTVESFAGRRGDGKARNLYWSCRCNCGRETVVKAHSLLSGHTQSCGCIRQQKIIEAVRIHGRARTPEYKAWIALRQRCSNPNDAGFINYGGRGITVCDRWSDFEAFFEDMGPRPSSKHSIERRDNSLGYTPSNCVWATKTEQCNNQRRNVRLTHDSLTLTVSQWSQRTGINHNTIRKRLRNGWPVAAALTAPVDMRFSTT